MDLNKLDKDYSDWMDSKRPDALNRVVSHFDSSIRGASQRVGGDDNVYNSLKLEVARKIPEFDPKKGDLQKHVNQILRRAPRISAQQGASTHVPEKASRDIGILRRAEEHLLGERGETPTMFELAEYTGIPVRRQSKLLKQYRKAPVMQSSIEGMTLPSLDDDRLSPEQQAWVEYTVQDLDKTDTYIYENLSEGLKSPAEIARDLNISPSAVSQRIQNINDKLSEVDFG